MNKNKIKSVRYESNDTKEIKNLIVITVVVVLIVGLLYFFTNMLNNKGDNSKISFEYDTCMVGNMFNRPYDEYYVFLFSSLDSDASTYKGLITSYIDSDDALKVYYVDMNDWFNSSYLGDMSNNKPTGVSDVVIKDSALIKIKDGSVVNYYDKLDDYKKVLDDNK